MIEVLNIELKSLSSTAITDICTPINSNFRTVEAFKEVDTTIVSKLYQLYRLKKVNTSIYEIHFILSVPKCHFIYKMRNIAKGTTDPRVKFILSK